MWYTLEALEALRISHARVSAYAQLCPPVALIPPLCACGHAVKACAAAAGLFPQCLTGR